MDDALIWLHEDALRSTHPVFSAAPATAQALFVWDNVYFEKLNYSLKRLVFIYESLSELPVEFMVGDTLTLLKQHSAKRIFVPHTNSTTINDLLAVLSREKEIITVDDTCFANVSITSNIKRFHAYWKQVERSAFLIDGAQVEKN